MPEQLSFDLSAHDTLSRDDFMVAPSNAVALAMIDSWENWDQGKFVLSGPPASGKTHLVHVWAAMTGARVIPAHALPQLDLAQIATCPVAIEDVPAINDDAEAQTALFHLHNMLQAAQIPLLMTGQANPRTWAMSLPDLQSRIDAAGHAALDPPDDALLAAVLAKLFADRQLVPKKSVIPYLVRRMERSFDAARRIVGELDQRSLATGKPVSRKMVKALLDIADETE